jgi:opacity protein-like surface antigen
MPESKYNPYAILGLGVNSVSFKSSFTSPVFGLNLTTSEGSYTSLAVSIGGGVETEIVKSVIVGCEARWRYMGNHDFGTNAVSVASHASVVGQTFAFGPASELALALRVGYKFGGK